MTAAKGLPAWAVDLLGLDDCPREGTPLVIGRDIFVLDRGVLRNQALLLAADQQVKGTFGYKWNRRDSFESEAVRAANRAWLIERYGDMSNAHWIVRADRPPIVLDAGCGAAFSA